MSVPRSRYPILLIASEPSAGGVKRHLIDLLHHLPLKTRRVLYVYSLCRTDSIFASELAALEERGIISHSVSMQRKINLVADFRAFLHLLILVWRTRPTIVHGHSSKAGFLLRLAASLAAPGCIRLYSPHVMASIYARRFFWLEWFGSRMTDHLIAVSPSEAADFERWQVAPKTMIRTLTLSANLTLPPARRDHHNHVTIVTCGRICQQKRGFLFFRIASIVLRSRKDVSFKWIGDYDDDWEADAVRKLREDDPFASQVEITGWLSNPDPKIQEADIFCMFSRYESFGYVVADAMAMGIPVIATNVTGLKDLVVDHETGFLCPPEEAVIVERLLKMIDDPEKRAIFGRAGSRRASEYFSGQAMTNRYHSFYDEITPTEVIV